jgi:hypothetical protein
VKCQSSPNNFQVEQLKTSSVSATPPRIDHRNPGTNPDPGVVTVHAEICNEPVFAPNSANESRGRQAASQAASWFRRALATLHTLKVIRTRE